MKLKRFLNDYIFYILLIPFLFPRGFIEYFSLYKSFYTVWLYFSVISIYIIGLFKLPKYIKGRNCLFILSIFLYFVVLASITFLNRGTFSSSLQKIFATPALCLLCITGFQENRKKFIFVTNNILTVMFILNITLFNPLLWHNYFAPIGNHITFLGHVQVVCQLGILHIILAFLEHKCFKSNKIRFVFQILLSLITMLVSFTSASYLAIIILVLFFIIEKLKLYNFINFNSYVYIILYLTMNLIAFCFIGFGPSNLEIFGFSLNGRGYIWKEALKTIFKSPIIGYGSQGALIKVFWSVWVGDGLGMNYMHNQILQIFLDGGIILFIPYLILLGTSFYSINMIKDDKSRYWLKCFMLITLMVSTFESTLEYFYMFYVFCIFAYLPFIFRKQR